MRFSVALIGSCLLSGIVPIMPATASPHGCQVILCLSNPGGPTQYGACVPPVTKLWRDLALGKAFPSCAGAGDAGVSKAKYRKRDKARDTRIDLTFNDGRIIRYFPNRPGSSPVVLRGPGATSPSGPGTPGGGGREPEVPRPDHK